MLPPLDDAACLYRAQSYSPTNTLLPNEGTRTEPLLLGPTLNADTADPVFVADAVLGDHLRYPIGQGCYAVSPVPPSIVNGDVSFAIRYRPEALWADRLLLSVIDPVPVTKHFMLHQTSGNKLMARFWEHPSQGWAQIGATSLTSVSLNRTDTVVVVWDSALKQVRLYLNGELEATGSTGKQRSEAVVSGLNVPYNGTTSLVPAYKVFSVACWDRLLSASEVAALTNNADWLAGGGTPPPPPEQGELIVRINGTVQPGASVLIDDVPVLPEGTVDKVVDVNLL